MAFPNTPSRDDFERANAFNLGSNYSNDALHVGGSVRPEVVGGMWEGVSFSDEWNNSISFPGGSGKLESWGTIGDSMPAKGVPASFRGFQAGLVELPSTDTDTGKAYQAYFVRNSSGGGVDGISLYRWINGATSFSNPIAFVEMSVDLQLADVYGIEYDPATGVVNVMLNAVVVGTWTDPAPLFASSSSSVFLWYGSISGVCRISEVGGGLVAAAAAPVNTVAPSISGSSTTGNTLTCTQGTWTNAPTSYAYQWKRGAANIASATANTYVLQVADEGQIITCVVTATNATGSNSATSNSIAGSPAGAAPSNTTLPSISGTAVTASTVTCSPGAWTNSPTSYAYQWKRNGSVIAGATATTYTLQVADQSQTVTCTVTATNASGSSSATTSGITPTAAPSAPSNTALPTISGAPNTGNVLTCNQGTWTGSPSSYSYQWKRDGSVIVGATLSTYTLVSADEAHAITCTVTATNGSGSTSATTASVTPSTNPTPSTILIKIAGAWSEKPIKVRKAGAWFPSS